MFQGTPFPHGHARLRPNEVDRRLGTCARRSIRLGPRPPPWVNVTKPNPGGRSRGGPQPERALRALASGRRRLRSRRSPNSHSGRQDPSLANDEPKTRQQGEGRGDSLTKDSTAAAEAGRTRDRYAAGTRNKADADAPRRQAARTGRRDLDNADREATPVAKRPRPCTSSARRAELRLPTSRRRWPIAGTSPPPSSRSPCRPQKRDKHRTGAPDGQRARAERTLAEARAQADAHLKAAHEEAAHHVTSAKANAGEGTPRDQRELQAATSRPTHHRSATNVRRCSPRWGLVDREPFAEPEVAPR